MSFQYAPSDTAVQEADPHPEHKCSYCGAPLKQVEGEYWTCTKEGGIASLNDDLEDRIPTEKTLRFTHSTNPMWFG